MEKVITLTGTLTNTGEHRVTTVGLGDVVDELLDKHGLTDTGTTEQTNLTTTSVRGKQVDDLNTGLENLGSSRLLNKGRRVAVDWHARNSVNRSTLVNGVTSDIDDTAERTVTDRNRDRSTSVTDLLATDKTISTVHGNAADSVLTNLLGDLKNEAVTQRVLTAKHLEGVVNGREALGVEVNVNDRADDCTDRANLARATRGLRGKATGCEISYK